MLSNLGKGSSSLPENIKEATDNAMVAVEQLLNLYTEYHEVLEEEGKMQLLAIGATKEPLSILILRGTNAFDFVSAAAASFNALD